MGFFKKLTQALLNPFGTESKSVAAKPAKKRRTLAASSRKVVPKKSQKTAKPVKKKPLKKLSKPKVPAKLKAAKPQTELSPGTYLGKVTHFFPQVNAAAVTIESGTLEPGHELFFKGATTNFKMKINSLQINRVPVTSASKGMEVGILVKKRVRQGDEVFKLP